MPSVSEKQKSMMAAIAHGWKPKKARRKLPSYQVALKFHESDYPSHRAKTQKSSDGPLDQAWDLLKSR